MDRSQGLRQGVTFAGGTAVVTALLTWLQTQVLSVHLYPAIRWDVSALLASVLALIPALATNRTQHADTVAKVTAINGALIGGAARVVSDRRVEEFGVRAPAGAHPQTTTDGICEALRESWLVCVIGSDSAGTAGTAFGALKEHAPSVRLLAPIDADGLRTVLDGVDPLRSALARVNAKAEIRREPSRRKKLTKQIGRLFGGTCGPLVVWLDGFDRFAAQLDGDGIRRFLAATHAGDVGADIRLLVTMRADNYTALMSGDGDAALRARRLLSGARLVELPPGPSSNGSAHNAGPGADGDKRYGAVAQLSPARTMSMTLIGLLALIAAAVIALLVLRHHYRGFTPPPPLNAQAQTIENALLPCETPEPPVPASSVGSGQDWVLPVQAGSCPRSDYVSIYANDSGHLDYVLTERPKSSAAWIFRCALTSGCAVSAGGRSTMIIGAFMRYSDDTQTALPIVLYADTGPTDIRLLAPYLPPPNSHVPPITLPLAPGAVSDLSSQSVCKRPAELCGVPPTYITALPADSEPSGTTLPENGVLLIAGYAQSGPYYAPTRVVTRAFVLQYTGANDSPPVRFGPTPCTSTTHHRYYKISHPPTGVPALETAMQRAWRGHISCPAVVSQ